MSTNTSLNKGSESMESSSLNVPKNSEHLDSKEVKKASVTREAVNTVEGAEITSEAAEAVNERVSESISKSKDQKGDGFTSGGAQPFDPAQIKAQLLKNLPTEKAMRSQIEREIKKEIKYLHRKAIKMISNPSGMSFFEMANVLRKIRELRGLIIKLAKASVEALKTLWLRFVHGIVL